MSEDFSIALSKLIADTATDHTAASVLAILVAADIVKTALSSRALIDTGTGQEMRKAFAEVVAEVKVQITKRELTDIEKRTLGT